MLRGAWKPLIRISTVFSRALITMQYSRMTPVGRAACLLVNASPSMMSALVRPLRELTGVMASFARVRVGPVACLKFAASLRQHTAYETGPTVETAYLAIAGSEDVVRVAFPSSAFLGD